MTFEWPLLLISLVLVPLLIIVYLIAQRRRRRYAVRFTNLALLHSVVGKGPGFRRHLPPLLYLLGLTALLVSLARPVAMLAAPREQADVMLVLDVSGSMTATDLQPNRMSAAQQAAQGFIDSLPTHARVGLVSFSNVTNLAAPLTHDREVVQQALNGLRASGGTAIGDGLARALEHLEQRPSNAEGQRPPAQIVLLSDGESAAGLSADVAAEQAAQAQVQVTTIGIGQRGATPTIRNNQAVGLDEETLRLIAERTGGEYFYAAEAGQLEQIYANLGTTITWVEERTEITAILAALGALFVIVGGLFALRWFQQFP
jgi:Ca-activated chloride channel family protein